MPRDTVSFQNTWDYLLREEIDAVVKSVTERGMTSRDLESRDKLERFNPDTVILQVGIVDLFPRYRNNLEQEIFRYTPDFLNKRYMNFAKRFRERKTSNCFVSLGEFKDNLTDYIERCRGLNAQVFLLKIAPATTNCLQYNQKISERIESYNECIESLADRNSHVTCVDPFNDIGNIDRFFVDHIHLDSEGHRKTTDCLKTNLDNLFHLNRSGCEEVVKSLDEEVKGASG